MTSPDVPWTERLWLQNLWYALARFVHVSCFRGVPVHVGRLLSRRSVVLAASVSTLAVATLPAGAASTASHGKATSSLTILSLRIGGQSVALGNVVAVAGNASGARVARLVVTPVTYNFPAAGQSGTIGQQTITPKNGSTTVPPSPSSIALPNGLGSVKGPTFAATAVKDASEVLATAKLDALGNVTLAGVPLDLHAASLTHQAKVVSTGATAEKSLSLGDLALPSLTDLLASLGLDLNATLDQLTQGKLTQLVGLVASTQSGAIATANSAVDAAQAGVTQAGAAPAATFAAAQAQLAAAQSDATAMNNAFDTAWSTAYGALGPAQAALDAALTTAGLSAPLTAAQFDDAVQNNATLLAALQTAFGATETTLASLAAAAVAADDLATAVNALVDALQNLVDKVLTKLNADGDPLASLGGVKLTTKAIAAGTPKAAASLTVASVDVLGQTASLSTVTDALDTVGSTLASVLNSVPGVTFTPPSIAIGKPSHSTRTSGTTRFASASVKGVTVNLPTLALSGAALPLALPGGINSGAGALVLGDLTESASWTPSSAQNSPVPGGAGGPQLGDTGGNVLLPILGAVILVVAAAVRRRWSAA